MEMRDNEKLYKIWKKQWRKNQKKSRFERERKSKAGVCYLDKIEWKKVKNCGSESHEGLTFRFD